MKNFNTNFLKNSEKYNPILEVSGYAKVVWSTGIIDTNKMNRLRLKVCSINFIFFHGMQNEGVCDINEENKNLKPLRLK